MLSQEPDVWRVEELPCRLQILFSYPLVMIAGAPFFALLPVLGLSGKHPTNIHFAGYDALVCFSVGVIAGWANRVPLTLFGTKRSLDLDTSCYCFGPRGGRRRTNLGTGSLVT